MANEEEEELLGVIKDVKGFLKRSVQHLNTSKTIGILKDITV